MTKLPLARCTQRLAAFIEADRLIEWDIPALKRLHDLFERGQGLLETHLPDILRRRRGGVALVHVRQH